MIKIIDFKCILEKRDTHQKYYPKVVAFTTVKDKPLSSAPQATITVIHNPDLNNIETVSQIEFDDIIRLQVSIRYHPSEKFVWVDLFQGRVQNQSKPFGTSNNNITLTCIGHIQAAFDGIVTVDRTYAGADATAILSALTTENLSRITYSADYAESGLTVTAYNAKAQQIYMVDVFKEMEKLSSYLRMIDVKPVYTATGNLNTCYLIWRAIGTTPTKKYKVIEGTPRLISASFDIIGDEVKNYRYVKGGTDSGTGLQYSGSSTDSTSISKYGTRYSVDTFSWIMSTTLCAQIALGLRTSSSEPYVAGQAVLEGTPDANIGDLVTVKIPSLEVKGAEVNGDYTVSRVTHNFNGSSFTTTEDFERIHRTEYDYINKELTQKIQTAYKNQVL